MTQFVNNDVASGNIIYASDHNTQGALLSAVLNGGIDDNNINASAGINGSKLADSSVTPAKLATGTGSSWSWTDYSSTSTITGWSSFTDKQIWYKQIGKTMHVMYALSGTSNATSISFTVPVAAVGHGNITTEMCTGLSKDNGSFSSTPARVYIDPTSSTTTVIVIKDLGTANWTSSGEKLIRGLYIYEVA